MQDPDGLGESYAATSYDVFAADVLGLIRNLQRMERRWDVALKHVSDVTKRKRRPPEVCLPMLVNDLANVYQHHTGRRATVTYNAITDEMGGPFLELVKAVVTELEPEKERSALAKTVKNILKERKRAQSEYDPLDLIYR